MTEESQDYCGNLLKMTLALGSSPNDYALGVYAKTCLTVVYLLFCEWEMLLLVGLLKILLGYDIFNDVSISLNISCCRSLVLSCKVALGTK